MAASEEISPTRGPLVARLFSALTLQRAFYERAAADETATGPAGAVLSLIALIREAPSIYELAQIERLWGLGLVVVVVLALLSWLILGAVAWVVARLFAPQTVGYRRLLRCLGFAQAPTLLLIVAYGLDPSLYLLAHVLLIALAFAGILVAMRAAASCTSRRAALLAVPVFLTQQLLLAATSF